MALKIGITEAGDPAFDYSWVEKMDDMDMAILITKNITDKFIEDGDTIKLLENVGYRQPAANVNFKFTKDLIIDGNNYTLSFRGSNLEILGDVEFKNIKNES